VALASKFTLAEAGAHSVITAAQLIEVCNCLHIRIVPRRNEIFGLRGRSNASVDFHARILEVLRLGSNWDKVLAFTGWAGARCIPGASLCALHVLAAELRKLRIGGAAINLFAVHSLARIAGLALARIVTRPGEGAFGTRSVAAAIAGRAVVDRVTARSITLVANVAFASVAPRHSGEAAGICSTLAVVSEAAVDGKTRCGFRAFVGTVTVSA